MLLANVWSIFLIIVFFGGSIFVHELGHFLAARRRGVLVERFSIGFGPPIWSHRGRDGVDYRVSWLPLGGYVLLPQLADLRGVEGTSEVDAPSLPGVSYPTKLIVFLAGVVCNLLFAFLLASILWLVGVPENSEFATTEIGAVSRTLEIAKGNEVPSPASQAGLRAGDIVRQIDGQPVADWNQLMQALYFGAGRDARGAPQTTFVIERAGRLETVVLHPQLSGDEKIRRVGIAPAYALLVQEVTPGSVAARAGLVAGDEILELQQVPVRNIATYEDVLGAHPGEPVAAVVRRAGARVSLAIPPRPELKNPASLGVTLTVPLLLTHPSPFRQVSDQVLSTCNAVKSLLNPHSDIGPSKFTGPVGIIRTFRAAADAGIVPVMQFTILLNVSLAIFNLLPFPPLDGSQILLATIARLRGRAFSPSLLATWQGVFIMLFISLFLYIMVFDMRRWMRDVAEDRANEAAAAAAAPAK